jgi:ATP-dependent DNA helicase RecQ
MSAPAAVAPGLADTPDVVLHRVFGFTEFRGQQRQVVEHVMAGGDALVLMPTGGGKSICYQLPASSVSPPVPCIPNSIPPRPDRSCAT